MRQQWGSRRHLDHQTDAGQGFGQGGMPGEISRSRVVRRSRPPQARGGVRPGVCGVGKGQGCNFSMMVHSPLETSSGSEKLPGNGPPAFSIGSAGRPKLTPKLNWLMFMMRSCNITRIPYWPLEPRSHRLTTSLRQSPAAANLCQSLRMQNLAHTLHS